MRCVCTILACVVVAAVTLAQDGAQEEASEARSDRLAQLEAELAELRRERDELRVRLGEAIEMLRNLGYAPPPPVLAEPSDPMASPMAAMQTLRRRARLELATLQRSTPDERAAYRDAARDWIETMNDGLAGERRWLVRATEVVLPASGSSVARARARLQLFDPATGAPLSLPMEVAVPGRVGRRMAEAGPNQGWIAHVVLKPMVRHNPDRVEAGPFDHPPFLAPEVEAEVEVQWLRFEPAEVPEGFFPALPGEGVVAAPPADVVAPADGSSPARQPR